MADFTAVRDDLAAALRAAGRVVYAYPNETITPPALVVVPGSPYLTPQTIGGLTNRMALKFNVTAVVAAQDNQAALKNLERLMLDVLTSLPAGMSVGAWSAPSMQEIGTTQMLTSQLDITVTTSL